MSSFQVLLLRNFFFTLWLSHFWIHLWILLFIVGRCDTFDRLSWRYRGIWLGFETRHCSYKGGEIRGTQTSQLVAQNCFVQVLGRFFVYFALRIYMLRNKMICCGLKKVVAKSRARVYFKSQFLALLLVLHQTHNSSRNNLWALPSTLGLLNFKVNICCDVRLQEPSLDHFLPPQCNTGWIRQAVNKI